MTVLMSFYEDIEGEEEEDADVMEENKECVYI
jgi:hypothetical protein